MPATLAPFVLLAARARWGARGLVLAYAFLAPPILLAGSRAAWLSYALVGVLLAWHETRRPRRFLAVCAVFAFGLGMVGAFALHDSARVGGRIGRGLLVNVSRGISSAAEGASGDAFGAVAEAAREWAAKLPVLP